jgi:hypothetical protein
MRHLIPISGKDSCATALVQIARQPDLPYELFFNDVGCELPETYAWLDRVEERLGRPLVRIGKSLEQIIVREDMLPSPQMRFCTRQGKIRPMEKWIGKDPATVYFGLRADEDRAGYGEGKANIFPTYPLQELGIDLPMVYAILDKADLRPPTFFWQRVHDLVREALERKHRGGFRLLPPADEVLGSLPRWVFDSLFAWRTRSNCFLCFFQRQYEWAGLLEHHPDLFSKAEEIEGRIGAAGSQGERRDQPYTWIAGKPLDWIRQNRERIVRKRVVQILKVLRDRRAAKDPEDLLSVTSCGFFCGK